MEGWIFSSGSNPGVLPQKKKLCCVIPGSRRDAAQSCIFLRYDAASSGKSLPSFQDVSKGYPETSASNYHYSLRNNPEECSSQLTGTCKNVSVVAYCCINNVTPVYVLLYLL